MSLLFSPYTFQAPRGPLVLPNRIVIAPMCQYAADAGCATDWHLTHWTNLLNGGAGLLILEATAVSPEGRITPGCLGLWDDVTQAALHDRLDRARKNAPPSPVCLQIGHAGRKASSQVPWHGGMLITPQNGGWTPLGPSALPHLPQEPAPAELTLDGIAKIRNDFVATARRAQAIGIDAIELHAAHGYLLHEFLSPIANQRTDAYGGSFNHRIRLVMELFEGVRQVFDGTLGIRLSGTDWVEGGWTMEESAELGQRIKAAGAQFVHMSSGGVAHRQNIPIGPEYQVHLARAAKDSSGLPTIAVGLITEPAQAEAIIQRGDADLVALARAFLYNPRWGWHAAAALQGQVQASPPYWRCLPKEATGIFGPEARIGMR
jgi:2,4-dienoyl-CoA reductase-like NADH-dependent reductase (Old Yellow Enzyme family)